MTDKNRQDKTMELQLRNIHDHGTGINNLWVKEVEKRTGGKVRFSRLVVGEQTEGIKDDIIRDVPARGGTYPLLDLIQTPFVFPNSKVGSRVIAQLYVEFSEFRQELSDVKILGLGIGALMAIFSSKSWGPIRTVDDFKGARIRSLKPVDKVMEAFGAKPAYVGFNDIAPQLETGKIDATILGIVPARMFKLAEGIAPYCTIWGNKSISMHPMRTYMRWELWNSFPPDVQKAIDEIGPSGGDCWFATHSGTDGDKTLKAAMDYARQYGEIINIPEEEFGDWQQLLQPVIDSNIDDIEAKGLPGRRFMTRMKELVTRYLSE